MTPVWNLMIAWRWNAKKLDSDTKEEVSKKTGLADFHNCNSQQQKESGKSLKFAIGVMKYRLPINESKKNKLVQNSLRTDDC